MITLRISKRYQYLVRNNLISWLAPAIVSDFGLTGGGENGDYLIKFIRGGGRLRYPLCTPLAKSASR